LGPEQSIGVPLEVLLEVTLIAIHEASPLTVRAFIVQRRSIVLFLQIWILREWIWLRIVTASNVGATIIVVIDRRRITEWVHGFRWHMHAWG
jgi:hypothetical protein